MEAYAWLYHERLACAFVKLTGQKIMVYAELEKLGALFSNDDTAKILHLIYDCAESSLTDVTPSWLHDQNEQFPCMHAHVHTHIAITYN